MSGFMCFKCQAKGLSFSQRRVWRGLAVCAACVDGKASTKPLADVGHGAARYGGVVPLRKGLLNQLPPEARATPKQPTVPSRGTNASATRQTELIAKVRGDIELRGMTIAEAARENGIKYERAFQIAHYVNAVHIEAK